MIFSIVLLILAFAFSLAAIHMQYEEMVEKRQQRLKDDAEFLRAHREGSTICEHMNEWTECKLCRQKSEEKYCIADQLIEELNKPREEETK